MITLLRNAEVFSPRYLGKQDILLAGGKIELIAPAIEINQDYVCELDCTDRYVVPGFIDGHVHLLGGGESPCLERIPESKASELASAGVTTAVGLLGTDSVTKGLENLYSKAVCLEREGISTYILTGAYHVPSPTLCGSITRDLLLVDKVIGVKISLSDHRSSCLTHNELAKLCSEMRIGALLSGKSGIVVIHMGSGKKGFTEIEEMLADTDLPITSLLPTHCGRNVRVFKQALDYAKKGGNIDFTAGQGNDLSDSAAGLIKLALADGVKLNSLTLSSDGYGSLPIFDEQCRYLGMHYSTCHILHQEFTQMVHDENMPLDEALCVVTTNVAERMGLQDKKGKLCAGFDADLLVLSPDLTIESVICGGSMRFSRKGGVAKY